jgi:ABC-type phosphate transport system substrate-binding protein
MNRTLRRKLVLAATGMCLLLSHPSGRAAGTAPVLPAPDESLAVIVNQANPIDELSLKDLRTVFLGERSHWPNGRRITLVMMDPGLAERKAVLRDVCRMSESEFSRHFLQGLFTGEVFVSPKTLSTPIGVRKFVFNVPGAIGYVKASDVDSTVKVIKVNGKSVGDPEYPLRVEARPAK